MEQQPGIWPTVLQTVITIITVIVASSGFWLFMDKFRGRKDSTRLLLIGLARDRIISLSLKHIREGSITREEYENLSEYLFKPYAELGGDGTATRLMAEVNKIKISDEVHTVAVQEALKGETDVPK